MTPPTISRYSQLFPPRAEWTVAEIPDLSDKVIVVTGGNSGIGYETVLELLRHNAKVYIAARNQAKVDAAIAELKRQPGVKGHVEFVKLDLADLRSIEAFAKEFSTREKQIDILFDNAGIMENTPGKTVQGFEQHVGINSIGTHYVTKLLLPLLKAATAAHPESPARVVFTSSFLHINAPEHGFSAEDPYAEKDLPEGMSMPMRLYGTSKFYNILSARKLQREHSDIVFTAVHPGYVRTPLLGKGTDLMSTLRHYFVIPWITLPQKSGAVTQLYAAFSEAGLKKGAYFVPYGREAATIPAGDDPKVQDAFVEWCESQIAKNAAA
ncbi:hypothetical protein MCUN1_003717 [Malassezia cuniculi]|uniref:NAD(P)-binding protein n=1 Tax=Malassezia cuniculi TaxID=948313 RepID=A0AAF0EY22_9BASI|nr:hypothetical protein MCUN1_003717 [Malassezia cuniculi]